MLKELKVLSAAIALLFVLVACSSERASNTYDVDEILKQSIVAMDELSSYSMSLESKQTMTIEDETITMLIKLDSDMIIDPLAFYQKLEMDTDIPMVGSYVTEMYLVRDRFYVFEPMMNDWMELPMDLTGEFEVLSEMQLSPEQQLTILHNFVDDIDMTERGNDYVLKLFGEGKDFMELATVFGSVGMGEFTEMLHGFAQLDLNYLEFEVFINKKTLMQTALNMKIDMTMNIDGEVLHTIQTLNSTVSGFNEVEEIFLPQGVGPIIN